MKTKAAYFIENGAVLDYCLHLLEGAAKAEFEHALKLYPELRAELYTVQEGLNAYAPAEVIPTGEKLKNEIAQTIENISAEENMNLQRLPLINRFSEYKRWRALIQSLLPEDEVKDRFVHVLRKTEKVTQLLFVSATDFPDEEHHTVKESFIILEGTCECRIGADTLVKLGPGGYLEVPMHQTHSVKITSPSCTGIVQFIAA